MNIKAALFGCAAGLFLAGNAQATLFDRGGGLIYDDDLNITWLQNAGTPLMNWFSAVGFAENFSYFDTVRNVTWNDWRLPSAGGEMAHLYFSELGGSFGIDLRYPPSDNYKLFTDIQPRQYWSPISHFSNPNYYAEVFNFYGGSQYTLDKYNQVAHTWMVRTGDVVAQVSSVPEPSGLISMAAGLAALALMSLRHA